MNTKNAALRRSLEEKQQELGQVDRMRTDIAIERSADQMDEIQNATERDLAILTVDRDSSMLRAVRGALKRIEDGSFGVCADCEAPISPKRIAAVPWATRCIDCQGAADRNADRAEEFAALGA